MPQWRVQRGSSLEHFLRLQGVQQWRIAILIDTGAVQVIRGNSAIVLKGPRTHVDQFDVVKLADPLSTRTQKALAAEASASARDYAFAPGTSKYDKTLASLLKAKPETILDSTSTTLVRFIKELANGATATNPIRHLLVGSHASSEGTLKLPMDTGAAANVTYDLLLDLIKSRKAVIDVKTLAPRPGDDVNKRIVAKLIIRGCRAGHQVKFVDKLRGALGGLVPVAAPIHYHLVTAVGKPGPGYVEYCGYAFELSSPTRFKNRAAVIAALKGKTFDLIDGSKLNAKVWDKWIPSNPHKLEPRSAEGEQASWAEAISPVDGKKLKLPRIYRYKVRKLLGADNKVKIPGRSKKRSDREKAAREQLEEIDFFKTKTDFPVYERYGYDSIDEFMKAWEWRFKPDTAADSVTYNAYRHEYRAVQPIAELENGKLAKKGQFILNYFPTTKRQKPVVTLTIDDPRLYLVR